MGPADKTEHTEGICAQTTLPGAQEENPCACATVFAMAVSVHVHAQPGGPRGLAFLGAEGIRQSRWTVIPLDSGILLSTQKKCSPYFGFKLFFSYFVPKLLTFTV